MRTRVITAIGIAAVAACVLLLGRNAIFVALLLLMLIGEYEIVSVLRSAGFRPVAWIHYVLVLSYIPAYLWLGAKGLIIVLISGTTICMAIASITREVGTTDLLATLLPSIYPAYPFVALAMVAASNSPNWHMLLVLLLLTSVASDVFALFVGSQFGKHKLIPKVSPNKTVEGAIGGFVGAILAALVMYAYGTYVQCGISIWHFLALGAIGGVATQIGDLIASYIKRFCKVKDYGTVFPGHGGVLDRMDGILVNAVAFCMYTMVFVL